MNSRLVSPGVLLTALAVVASLMAGCATTPARRGDNGAPCVCLACVREAGLIGVISTSTVPKFSVQLPLNREQAVNAWRQTANYGSSSDENRSWDERDLALVQGTFGLGLGWIAFGGLAGQVIGNSTAISAEQLQAADQTMHRAVADSSLQECVRRRIVALATAGTSGSVRLVPKPFPPGAESEYSQMASVMCATLAWLPAGQNATQYLAAQGVDTVLEIQLVLPRLTGQATVNPALAVMVEGSARLVSVRDGTELASIPLRYHGVAHKFTAWAADDASAFRAEIERCGEDLAVQCIANFFPTEMAASAHSGSCHRRTLASR